MFRPLALTLALGITAVAQPPEDQVRRIFSDSCLGCHGSSRISDLSVATRESMLEGGKHGPAIVPGKASESLLYKAVAHEGEIRMPPGKPALTADKLEIIRQWIDAGAPWSAKPAGQTSPTAPEWWSFKKPVKPNAQSIDELARADRKSADRRTLIRRATLELRPPGSRLGRVLRPSDLGRVASVLVC